MSWSAPWIRMTSPSSSRTASPIILTHTRFPVAVMICISSWNDSPLFLDCSNASWTCCTNSGAQKSSAVSMEGSKSAPTSWIARTLSDQVILDSRKSTIQPPMSPDSLAIWNKTSLCLSSSTECARSIARRSKRVLASIHSISSTVTTFSERR